MSASLKVKRRLWKRDSGRCFYCGVSLSWDTKTIDHVIPKSKGGPHRAWNLVISCVECNRTKGDSDPTPDQLDLVLRRKILHESQISIGQAIEHCKKQANKAGAAKLIELQKQISEMILIGSPPSDFVLVFNNR